MGMPYTLFYHVLSIFSNSNLCLIKNETKTNQSVNIVLRPEDMDGYDGVLAETFETLKIDFRKGWSFELNYTLINKAYYELNSINFHYVTDSATFPNISEPGKPFTVSLGNMTQFSANKDNSYKCFAKSVIDLNADIQVEFTNYQAQPFLSAKSTGFDTGNNKTMR